MNKSPFLWLNLAGFAVFPIAIQIVWLGLAVGQPLPFFWLELILLGIVGVIPVVWIQWSKPFSPFNLLFLTLKPDNLSESQRRILTGLKTNRQRLISAIASILILVILWYIYKYAPLATSAASFLPQVRILGLLIAIVAFFIGNFFLQTSLSIIPLILINSEKYNSLEPYPLEKIKQDFTLLGFPVSKLLPSFLE